MEAKTIDHEPLIPENESLRIKDLDALELLDTGSERIFDRFTELCRDLFHTPIVLISLVDSERQWFKSACGLADLQTPRAISFCGHAINENGLMVVPDTHADPRFANNPLVTDAPFIRFYAGAVLYGPAGYPIGTLCLADRETRDFSKRDQDLLVQIAKLLKQQLDLRFELINLRRNAEKS